MARVGPWVMVSPDGVRYYVRNLAAANALADDNADVKMTRPNLHAYAIPRHHGAQHGFEEAIPAHQAVAAAKPRDGHHAR